MKNYIDKALEHSINAKKVTVAENKKKIIEAVDLIINTFNAQNKLLVCGNGGSACDSLHICGEFTNRLLKERRPLAAIPLNSDVASLTAIANDYSFDKVFSKQVEAFGKKDDLLWVLTTSGNSKNILEAAKSARSIGMKVFSFSGGDGGNIIKLSDLFIVAKDKICSRIQETHSFLYHVIIEMVEEKMFGEL